MSEQKRNTTKNQICLGLLAHVDAGKTTLSEAMLYEGGQLRRLGRVDHQDAFLDTDVQERERGITILSKNCSIKYKDVKINVIDTPGFLSDDTAEYAKNADIAIIPVQPGTLGLKPMKRTIKVITEANPDLSFAIIINNFAGTQTVDRQFLELLEADDLPVLGTVPTAAAFKQGAALGKPVYEIAKNGKAAQAIENILNELEEVL